MGRQKIAIKRELWGKRGYVNVARLNGKLITWEKWNRKTNTLKTFQQRKSKSKPKINPNVVAVKSYKKVNKLITAKPIKNEVGQVMLKIEAKKGKEKVRVDGYSFLNDASRGKKQLDRMITQATKSAYAKIPFSPDSMRIIAMKFIYFVKK